MNKSDLIINNNIFKKIFLKKHINIPLGTLDWVSDIENMCKIFNKIYIFQLNVVKLDEETFIICNNLMQVEQILIINNKNYSLIDSRNILYEQTQKLELQISDEKKKFQDLETEVLETEVQELEKEVRVLETEVRELETEVREQRYNKTEFEKNIKRIEEIKQIQQITEQIKLITVQIDNNIQQIQQIKAQIQQIKAQIQQIKAQIQQINEQIQQINEQIQQIQTILQQTNTYNFLKEFIKYSNSNSNNKKFLSDLKTKITSDLQTIKSFLNSDSNLDNLFIIFRFIYENFNKNEVYNRIFQKIYIEIYETQNQLCTNYNILLVLYMEYQKLMNTNINKDYNSLLRNPFSIGGDTFSIGVLRGGSAPSGSTDLTDLTDLKQRSIEFFTLLNNNSPISIKIEQAKELIIHLKASNSLKVNNIDYESQKLMYQGLTIFFHRFSYNFDIIHAQIIFVIINLYTELIEKNYITIRLKQDFEDQEIKEVGIHIFINLINQCIFSYNRLTSFIPDSDFLQKIFKPNQYKNNIYPYLESDLVHLVTKMHKYQKFLYKYTRDYVEDKSIHEVIRETNQSVDERFSQINNNNFALNGGSGILKGIKKKFTDASSSVKRYAYDKVIEHVIDPTVKTMHKIAESKEEISNLFRNKQLIFLPNYSNDNDNDHDNPLSISKFDLTVASGVVIKNNLNTFSDNNYKLILILNNLVTCLLDKDRLEDINNFWDQYSDVNFESSKILGESYDNFQIEINGDKTTIGFGNLFPLTTCIKQICKRIDLTNESIQKNILIRYTQSKNLIDLFITLWGWYHKEIHKQNLNNDKNFNNFLAKLAAKNIGKYVDRNNLLLGNKYESELSEYYFKQNQVVLEIDVLQKEEKKITFFSNSDFDYISNIKFNEKTKIITVGREKYKLDDDETFHGNTRNNYSNSNKLTYTVDINPYITITTKNNNCVSFVTRKDSNIYYYCLEHGVCFYTNNRKNYVKHLKSGNEYELIETNTPNKILQIFVKFSKNISLVKDTKTDDLSLMVVMNKENKYTNRYWKANGNIINIENNKIHFIQINSNYFTFKFPSIDDFHALFISFILTENIHALYLLKNRITSDVTKISLHPNKNEYLYYSIINSLSSNMDIPFAYDFEKKIDINTSIVNKLISEQLNLTIDSTSKTTSKPTSKPTRIELKLNSKYLNNISFLSDFISSKKIQLVDEQYNQSLKDFLKEFRSVCTKLSINYEIFEQINMEDIDEIYYNKIFDDILNLENFYSINRLYLANTDLLYDRLIAKKYNSIVDKLNSNQSAELNEACGEVLRIISELDPLVIHGFDKPRSQSQIVFELHNEIFIRAEQRKLIDSFFSNGNLTNTAYEILMGKGKTSTLTPEYILEHYEKNTSFNYVIVLPSHLVLSSYDIFSKIIDLFDGYCLRIYPQVDINQRLEITDIGFPTITIVSDSTLKHYVLDIISKGEKTIDNIFNGSSNVFVFDEIDTLVNPLKSYLNIGGKKIPHRNIEKLVQVLYQVAINIYLNNTNYLESTNISDKSTDPFEQQLYKTITDIYPIVRSYKYKKNYGFVSYQLDINDNTNTAFYKTVPYSAINSPVDGSEFSDFEISILLTFLSYLNCTEIRLKDCDNIYEIFKKIYKTVDRISKQLFQEKIIEFFNLFAGYNNFIDTMFTLLSDDQTTPVIVHAEINKQISSEIDENNRLKITLIYFYIIYFVRDKCFKYPEDKYNIATIDLLDTNVTPNKICFSGTVNFNLFDIGTVSKLGITDFNLNQYVNEQLNRIESNPIAQGEIESAIRSITTIGGQEIKHVPMIYQEDLIEDEIIKYLLYNIKKYNALIDVGGYILKTKPKDLMEKVWNTINRSSSSSASSSGASESNRKLLYINENNIKTIYMGPNKPGQKYSNEVFENCFIFYDNKNCVGTDFKQPYKMHGLITIGRLNNLTEIAQGVYRLRNINIGHTVDYISPDTFARDPDDGQPTNKYKLIYDNLLKADQDNKANLEINALIQFVKFIKRKHFNYNNKYYQEQNYISTVPFKSKSWLDLTFKSEQYITQDKFLEQELVSSDFKFNTESIKKQDNISQPEILLNIDINIDVNIDINANKQIDYTVSINNLLLYNGDKKTFVGYEGFVKYLLSPTTFEFAGFLNKVYKNIKIFDYELIISQDVLSHIELEKNATKNKKQYYEMFFKNLFILQIFKDDRLIIRIISFYEYILFKQFVDEFDDFKYILYSSTGFVERQNFITSKDEDNIEQSKMYKELAVILFRKMYTTEENMCIIARYFILNNFEYKKELLDILQSILKVKYLFNYQSINSSQFQDNLNNQKYWEQIIKNGNVEKVLNNNDFENKFDLWVLEVNEEIKQINIV